jgi:AcrR family transcriptional regulator
MQQQWHRTLTPRGERRRRAVLQAAAAVFSEHGFAETSLDMVIERGGGSRRLLYEQFGSKEGLFAASVEMLLERLHEQLSCLALEPGEPEQDLTRAGIAFLSLLLEPSVLGMFRMVLAEAPRFPDLATRFYERGPGRGYAMVAAYLQQQADAGRLDIVDSAIAARQLVEMIKGEWQLRALLRPGEAIRADDLERHVRAAVRTFLHGTACGGGECGDRMT